MSNKVENRILWDSRLAYISATINMVVGFGALWCFLMVFAQNSGRAFALAYVLLSIVIAIHVGWAEIDLGRWMKSSPVDDFGKVAGKPGRIIGYLNALIPLGFNIYYLIVIAWILAYIFYTFTGAYMADLAGFYNTFSSDKMLAGFTTISAVVLFNMNLASGIGLMFTVLSKVFEHMLGTLFMAFDFLIALFFDSLSSAIVILEIFIIAVIDALKWDRKKAVLAIAEVLNSSIY